QRAFRKVEVAGGPEGVARDTDPEAARQVELGADIEPCSILELDIGCFRTHVVEDEDTGVLKREAALAGRGRRNDEKGNQGENSWPDQHEPLHALTFRERKGRG